MVTCFATVEVEAKNKQDAESEAIKPGRHHSEYELEKHTIQPTTDVESVYEIHE